MHNRTPRWDSLDARVLDLPVGHLQLSERARLALSERQTIGGIVSAFHGRSQKWTSLVRSELDSTLCQLERCLRRGTTAGWEEFRLQRPKAADKTAVYFASFSFDRLSDAVGHLPANTLHPSARAATAFDRAKIATVVQLVDAAKAGLVNPHPAGAETCMEIVKMLEVLAGSLQHKGTCDWEKYVRLRGVRLLPDDKSHRVAGEDVFQMLPEVVKEAVFLNHGRRGATLVREYLLPSDRGRRTFAEIARASGVSRQNIQHLYNLILSELEASFLRDDYASCRFRFRDEFSRPFKRLAAALSRAGGRAVSYAEWKRMLTPLGPVASACSRSIERGLIDILGFRLIVFQRDEFKPIVLPAYRKASSIRLAVTRAKRLLARKFALGISEAELFNGLRSASGGTFLRETDMAGLISSIPNVRRDSGTGLYRMRLGDVTTLPDRVERVMQMSQFPLHFRKLAQAVNPVELAARKANERSVGVVLSRDKRFRPLGRTGFWALANRGPVGSWTVSDLAEDALTRREKPMTEAELFALVSEKRPVSRNAIRARLFKNPRFVRVAPKLWALAKGGAGSLVKKAN
ncbi:MAG: hypothetical protein H0U23_12520 [Blastocatellia bacterium]|nr:hypothetical protein [Blastocatellia bacterium]